MPTLNNVTQAAALLTDFILGNRGGVPNGALGTDLMFSVSSLAALSSLQAFADQAAFEAAWATYGVTFNGVTDDAVALQNCINQFAADGLFHKLTFPPNKTILLNSVFGPTGTINGAGAGTAPGWNQTGVLGQKWYYANVTQTGYFTLGPMLYIPGNISIDFNGCTLYGGSNAAHTIADCLVAYTPNPNINQWSSAGDSFGLCLTKYERGAFTNFAASSSSFVGSVSGNQLTVSSGTVTVGNIVVAPGLPPGTKISSGSNPYTLATSSGLGTINATVPAGTSMICGATLNTAFNLGNAVLDGLGSGVTANGGDSRIQFHGCYWFFPGKNGVVLNDQAYLMSFHDCEFNNAYNGTSSAQGGGLCIINGQNTSAANNENTSFYHCLFYGGGVGFITYGSEANFFGCSFDYLQQAISVNEYTGLGPNVGYNHKISTFGCHFECFSANTHYQSPQYYIDLTNSQSLLWADFGSFFYTQGQLGTGGNVLSAMVNPGSGGAAAPYGVSLHSPGYLLQGLAQSLNSAGGTNYLVTASASSGVLTISGASASGTIGVGGLLQENDSANVIPPGTTITSLGSGTGGNGTYNLSNASLSFTSRSIYVWNQIPLTNAGATSRYAIYP
jgi:hypothetical protein